MKKAGNELSSSQTSGWLLACDSYQPKQITKPRPQCSRREHWIYFSFSNTDGFVIKFQRRLAALMAPSCRPKWRAAGGREGRRQRRTEDKRWLVADETCCWTGCFWHSARNSFPFSATHFHSSAWLMHSGSRDLGTTWDESDSFSLLH